MRLYYTAILRLGWGFEGVRMGFWWGFNGIQKHFNGEYDEQNFGFGFPNDEAAPSDSKIVPWIHRLGRQPLFWFGSKDGGQPTWAWACNGCSNILTEVIRPKIVFFWRVGLPEGSLLGARWVVVKGGVSQMVCHQHVKPTRTLLRGHTHTYLYIYISHYLWLFMIIYAMCVWVCQSPSRQAEMWNMQAVQKGQRFLDNQATGYGYGIVE